VDALAVEALLVDGLGEGPPDAQVEGLVSQLGSGARVGRPGAFRTGSAVPAPTRPINS
jgi:hypothetical protein